MARDDNYFQSLFDIQSNNFNEFRHEMRADIRDVWTELKEIKEDVSAVKSDVGDVKNEVKDLKATVTNHINSEISTSNKKSLTNTPPWILLLFIFMLGRISVEVIDVIENGRQPTQPLVSQDTTFAPASSTSVIQKPAKTMNRELDKKIIKHLSGLIDQ